MEWKTEFSDELSSIAPEEIEKNSSIFDFHGSDNRTQRQYRFTIYGPQKPPEFVGRKILRRAL